MKKQKALLDFAKIFEKNPAMMAIVSVPGSIFTEVNDSFVVKLGYSRDELVDRSVCEVFCWKENEIGKLIENVKKGEHAAEVTLRLKAKNNKVFRVLLSGAVVETESHKSFIMVMLDITEQIMLSEQREKQKQRMENIIEGTKLGTWEWNIQTGEIFLNERWAEIIGYRLKDLQPVNIKTWMKLTHPDDLVKSKNVLKNHFDRKTEYYDFETRMKHKNGGWVWVLNKGKVIEWTDDGRALRMFGTYADVTLQKQAEDRLRESEKRYNLAFDGANVGLWDWDLISNTVYYSPKWKEMLGYAEHEIANTFEGWKRLWHPDDKAGIEKAMEDYHSGKTAAYELIHRLLHKDGEYRWILTRGSIIRDSDGRPYRWVGTNIDVTAEREEKEEIERFFSVNLDLLCIIDMEGNFVKVNIAWTDILGYTVAELEKRKMFEFVHPEDMTATVAVMAKLANQERVFNFVSRFRSKDGGYRYIEWRAYPYGKLIYSAARDISKRIEYEKTLRELATRDPLTNIHNRKYIFERLDDIISEYKRDGRIFSVAIIDIDHFKRINDEYGHLAGDYILKGFARFLTKNLRTYDLLGRYGGEEFIFVSMNTPKAQCLVVVERILEKLRHKVFLYNQSEIRFTFSAGISDCLEYGKGINIEKIIKKADDRLYEAKRTGRNKVVFFEVDK